MELTVHRKYRKETYTIGDLCIDGVFFCNTLEDKDRGLRQTDDLARIKAVKVPSQTAIPVGRYNVSMDVISPKYSGVAFYRDLRRESAEGDGRAGLRGHTHPCREHSSGHGRLPVGWQ